MIKSKVRGNKAKNRKLNKNNINLKTNININEHSCREKIRMIERKSAILSKVKKNFIKIAALVSVILVILIFTNLNKKIVIDEYTNIAELSSNKYSKEIIQLYNRDGELDTFLKEMNRVQSLIGVYVISNSTLKESSFSDLVKNLNKEINNNEWIKLNSSKSIYYNGQYTIDDSGNLKFKFGSKNIEPSWINDESIRRYITLN